MTKKKKFNVITIKWGDLYNCNDVNKIFSMVKRNSSFDIDFYCFTDNKKGLDKEIIAQPMPKMNMDQKYNVYAYRKEAGLCDDNLGGLKGQRVLFLDLDMLVVDNIDDFFTLPKKDEVYMINDWNSKGDKIGQASCYSWKVGTMGYIKEYFEEHPQECIDKFFTASQEYFSAKVIEKYGKLNFWPAKWCKSFRFHCLPIGILRAFIDPKLPKGCKILAFHGDTKMKDAIKGKWGEHKKEGRAHNWKRLIYKRLRPTHWIKDYYK